MGALFSSPKAPAAPAAPGKTSAEIAQAKARERQRLAAARGRSSTILGGSVGETGQGKRLLGG